MLRNIMPMRVIGWWLLVVSLTFTTMGCRGSSPGPQQLVIEPGQYEQAFDASVEVARQQGMFGGLRDRRTGVIETMPAQAPNIMEPWHTYREPTGRVMENTFSLQRRRARFEFSPSQPSADDLSVVDGPLELRVLVYVERSHRPGVRRSTWTRRATTWSTIIEDGPVGRNWVPIGRDVDMERRLLAAVQLHLATP